MRHKRVRLLLGFPNSFILMNGENICRTATENTRRKRRKIGGDGTDQKVDGSRDMTT